MNSISHYTSPLGDITLAADETGLNGLWFEGQKHFALPPDKEHTERETPILTRVKHWLNIYFSAKDPDFGVPLHLTGSDFQKEVWMILRSIPYGSTMTYGQIAKLLAQKRNLPHMSAQAVGGAVARNPISIIVPCHRVVGANSALTGYAGGLERKIALLQLEGAYDVSQHCISPQV